MDNLDVDTKFSEEFYHSDQIFTEELTSAEDDGDIEKDKFLSPSDAAEGRQEQTK